MSLDVYLVEDLKSKVKAWEERRAKSLEEAGSMVGLIPLIEEYYQDRKPNQRRIVFDQNITHNLGKMADAAGIYQHLWRPEELNITRASELINPLMEGLKKLKEQPDYFRQFNAPNGWGVYEHFVSWVEKYLEACIENSDCLIEVSR